MRQRLQHAWFVGNHDYERVGVQTSQLKTRRRSWSRDQGDQGVTSPRRSAGRAIYRNVIYQAPLRCGGEKDAHIPHEPLRTFAVMTPPVSTRAMLPRLSIFLLRTLSPRTIITPSGERERAVSRFPGAIFLSSRRCRWSALRHSREPFARSATLHNERYRRVYSARFCARTRDGDRGDWAAGSSAACEGENRVKQKRARFLFNERGSFDRGRRKQRREAEPRARVSTFLYGFLRLVTTRSLDCPCTLLLGNLFSRVLPWRSFPRVPSKCVTAGNDDSFRSGRLPSSSSEAEFALPRESRKNLFSSIE